jgi:hypothetical protein
MENSIQEQNKAIVLEAFETAFQSSRLPGGRTGSLTGISSGNQALTKCAFIKT